MKRVSSFISWVVVASEVSHVFCCVLPSVFSILTILVGLGVVGIIPVWVTDFHDVMHVWEIPIIMTSGVVLLLGWGLHFLSQKIDCHDTGCCHEPCAPKKKNTAKILKIATFLFLINILIYMAVHHEGGVLGGAEAIHAEHGHDDHGHHDHHGHDH